MKRKRITSKVVQLLFTTDKKKLEIYKESFSRREYPMVHIKTS